MTSRLPTGWQMVSLRRIMQEIERGDPTTLYQATFNYIDIASVDNEAKTISTELSRESRDAPIRARQLVQAGDVVVSTVRPRLNAVALIPTNLENAVASTGFCVLRPKNEILLSDYLFLFCTTPTFINQLAARERGASYPAVTDEDVLGTKIPLPPLSEQRRIVKILNEARDIRSLRQQADDLTTQLFPAIFNEMFGDSADGRGKFETYALKELLNVKSGSMLTASNMAKDGSFPVYGGNGINGYHDQFMFAESRVVIGRVGAYCGVVHLTKPFSWITDNALYVNEIKTELEVVYLAAALERAKLNRYSSRGGQPLISAGRIYPVRIPVPPLEVQREFVERVKVVNELDLGESYYHNLHSSLLAYAFSGELTADWRSQNLELLAREASDRDRWFRENGVKILIADNRIHDRLDDSDGRIAALNREQRKLLEQIQNLDPEENGGTFTLSSVSKTLKEPLDTLSIDSVRRHLDVLVSLGLIKAVIQRAGSGGSVGLAFGNAYRLPKSSKTAASLSIEPDLARSSEVDRLSRIGKKTLRNKEAFEAARAMFNERSTSDDGG